MIICLSVYVEQSVLSVCCMHINQLAASHLQFGLVFGKSFILSDMMRESVVVYCKCEDSPVVMCSV